MTDNQTTASAGSIAELLAEGKPAHSTWLLQTWEKLNDALFNGALTMPKEVDWVPNLPAEARYYRTTNIIALNASRYSTESLMQKHTSDQTVPTDEEFNKLRVILCLLAHEMVHQYIAQLGSGSIKHDAEFVRIANSLPRTDDCAFPNCDIASAAHWPLAPSNAGAAAIDVSE